MEYKSDTYSSSLYLCRLNHRHHLLFLLLVLVYFLLAMASIHNNVHSNPGYPNQDFEITTGFISSNHARDEDNAKKENELQCQCPPSAYECPLTIEPEAFKQLKNNLGPVIRQRLRDLLKKAINVEYAIETAHTIDLLNLLNELNSELDAVRENMHRASTRICIKEFSS